MWVNVYILNIGISGSIFAGPQFAVLKFSNLSPRKKNECIIPAVPSCGGVAKERILCHAKWQHRNIVIKRIKCVSVVQHRKLCVLRLHSFVFASLLLSPIVIIIIITIILYYSFMYQLHCLLKQSAIATHTNGNDVPWECLQMFFFFRSVRKWLFRTANLSNPIAEKKF